MFFKSSHSLVHILNKSLICRATRFFWSKYGIHQDLSRYLNTEHGTMPQNTGLYLKFNCSKFSKAPSAIIFILFVLKDIALMLGVKSNKSTSMTSRSFCPNQSSVNLSPNGRKSSHLISVKWAFSRIEMNRWEICE